MLETNFWWNLFSEVFPYLLAVILGAFIIMYPFYLRKYKSVKYKGFWKAMGEVIGSPWRILPTLIAFAVASFIFSWIKLILTPEQNEIMSMVARMFVTPLFVLFVIVFFAMWIIKVEYKIKELEKREKDEKNT